MYREQRHGRHADGEREREDFRPVTRHLVIERIFRLEPRRFHDDEYDAQPDAQRRTVFIQLNSQRVLLEGMILKPNMVLPGLTCPTQGSVDEVANITVKSLWRTVPAAVPGIAFLSGGQSAELASARLNTMNLRFKSKLPWALAFSFARAIQQPALEIWQGKDANVLSAQQAESSPEPKAQSNPDANSKPAAKVELAPAAKVEPKPETKPDVKPEATSEPKSEIKTEPAADAKAPAKPEAAAVSPSSDKAKPKPDLKADAKPTDNAEPKPDAKVEAKPDTNGKPAADVSPQLVQRVHKFYEQLGREDVRAVEESDLAKQKSPEVETKK